MAVDADTTLAANAVEKLMAAFDGGDVAAACGFVVPRHVRTIWERGRYIEYLFAFTFYKQVHCVGLFFGLSDGRAAHASGMVDAHAGGRHGSHVELLPGAAAGALRSGGAVLSH
jgi:hypothetical protein